MPPRPIHRLKSFWLGLLVLIFLGWAWVRSTDGWDEMSFKASRFSIICTAGNHSGALSLAMWDFHPFADEGLEFSFNPSPLNWRIRFPQAITFETAESAAWMAMSIAHWFLILLFLVPWASFLFWRVRRMRRAARSVGSS